MRAHFAYLRPRTFLPTFVLTATGWAASPTHARTPGAIAAQLSLLFLVYSVLLWGGANAFNSAEDRDEAPVNLLPDPPPRPATLGAFGLGSSALAIPVGTIAFGLAGGVIAAISFMLSIFYSWRAMPGRRAKEIGGLDNLVNALGAGLLAILLGWSASGAEIGARALAIGGAFTVSLLGGYPATQIFQLREGETYTEARNFTSRLGPARALRVGAILFVVHAMALVAIDVLEPPLAVNAAWLVLRAAWLFATLGSASHSWGWAHAPFDRPYLRMTRQLVVMLGGQACWALAELAR